MNLKEKIKESKDNMFSQLNNIDIEGLKTEGISMRIGDRILKFSVDTDKPILEIDIIKKEFRDKLNEQQKTIKEKINNEIEKINGYHNSLKIESERKEKILEQKLRESQPMPDITYKDAQAGLSLTKGEYTDTLCWLISGVYWPKYVDGKPIDKKFTKRMISPVVYMIITKNEYITEVSTRKPIGLDYFDHYHQSFPDCWGKWVYKKTWKTPNDILTIGREAESILENINTGSIAIDNPRGLPRKNTVFKYIIKESNEIGTLSRSIIRQGITSNIRSDDSEIWSL